MQTRHLLPYSWSFITSVATAYTSTFVRTTGARALDFPSHLPLAASSGFLIFLPSRVYSQTSSSLNLDSNVEENMPSSSSCLAPNNDVYDKDYPGTAVQRLHSVHERIKQLVAEERLSNRPWEEIRKELLWAGGLRDLKNVMPGKGYTGHSFNDYNHVDLTTMNDEQTFNEHAGQIKGIALGNKLGDGIRIASLPELGPGGSWSTCSNGCHLDPPQDVAHIQFRSRIAFKLVWVPTSEYDTFVLVDDHGELLARGVPIPGDDLPSLSERARNYQVVNGSKYAKVANLIAEGATIQ